MAFIELVVQTVQIAEREFVISVSGELDLHSVGSLQEALDKTIANNRETVVVDLGDVVLIDSIALGTLARASRSLRESGGVLTVAATNAEVVRAFEITSLDRVIPIARSATEALDSVRRSAA